MDRPEIHNGRQSLETIRAHAWDRALTAEALQVSVVYAAWLQVRGRALVDAAPRPAALRDS